MRTLCSLAAVGLIVSSIGCASGPTPLQGLIFADTQYPGYYEGVSEEGPGSKSGTSSMVAYLGLIAMGDASIEAACQDGGIKQIKTVDHHYKSILGIIQNWETNVTGE